jgi:hypothetical protein
VLFDPRVPAPDNALNLWFLLKGPVVSRATVIGLEGPLPLRALSYAMWIGVVLEPMRRLCRRRRFDALSLAAAVCAYGFFLFAIGVRDRYGFPVAALLVPIALVSWEGAALYVLVSAALMANMLCFFMWDPSGRLEAWLPDKAHVAAANLVLFAWLVWFAIRVSSWPEPADVGDRAPDSGRGGVGVAERPALLVHALRERAGDGLRRDAARDAFGLLERVGLARRLRLLEGLRVIVRRAPLGSCPRR